MSVSTTVHLNFRGQAREALAFYHAVFGGTIALVTYQDAQNVQHQSEADHIMWGQVETEAGFRVMAYDVPAYLAYEQGVNSFFVSVRGTDPVEISSYWQALSEGSTVLVDLGPASWSSFYGMLRDRFGVVWVLDVAAN
jgi:PhnB protein